VAKHFGGVKIFSDISFRLARGEAVALVGANGTGHTLPFDDTSFDHVLGWNAIYHDDEDIVLRTIAEIRRALQSDGTYLGTMLSRRGLPHEHKKAPGHEISRNTWIFDSPETDKIHPHHYCDAAQLLALFSGFEVVRLEDREHEMPGSCHWHLLAERL